MLARCRTFIVCISFCFKQKTAYDFRISDWSSDVCASDLAMAGLPGAAEAQQRGGILEYGIKAEPETFDIHGTNAYGVMHYLPQHYSTLLTFDWRNFPKIVGDVAESWEVSDDNLTYTFKIREGIAFHDGTALTAEDVKASFDRMRHPPEGVISARQHPFESIDSIETPDDHTV